MMRRDGAVVEQPLGQFAVEFGQVGEQQILVVVHQIFLRVRLKRSAAGVHFGRLGTSPPVGMR